MPAKPAIPISKKPYGKYQVLEVKKQLILKHSDKAITNEDKTI